MECRRGKGRYTGRNRASSPERGHLVIIGSACARRCSLDASKQCFWVERAKFHEQRWTDMNREEFIRILTRYFLRENNRCPSKQDKESSAKGRSDVASPRRSITAAPERSMTHLVPHYRRIYHYLLFRCYRTHLILPAAKEVFIFCLDSEFDRMAVTKKGKGDRRGES